MKKKFLSLLTLLCLAVTGAWADSQTIMCGTVTNQPFTYSDLASYSYTSNNGWAKDHDGYVISITDENSFTFTNKDGVTITGITIQGVADNNAAKNSTVTISDGTNSVSTGSISWKSRKGNAGDDPTAVAITSGISSLNMAANTVYTVSNSGYNLGIQIVITYTSSSSTKTETGRVLTGININNEAWDISGLSNNAATISTAYSGAPSVEFVYTINYDDETSDEGKKETVVATQSGANYVATSTALTNNVTLTFTNVTKEKAAAGLAYGTASVTKDKNANAFINTLTNPHGLTVTYSITNNGTGSTINSSTGQVTVGSHPGTETITASSEETATYLAGEATYTLKVNADVSDLVAVSPGYTFIADNVTDNGTVGLTEKTLYDSNRIYSPSGNSVATNKGNNTFAGGEHLNSLRVKSSSQDPLVFKVDRPCVITFYTENPGKSRTIKVGNAIDNNSYGTIADANEEHTVTISSAGLVVLTGTGDRYLAGFEVKALNTSVTVPTTGYSTYVNRTYALDFTGTAITPYVIKYKDDASVTLSAKYTVAAGEPVLLKAEGGAEAVAIPAIAEATADASNMLVAGAADGSTVVTYDEANSQYNYILWTNNSNVTGFYRANNSPIANGKAYLHVQNPTAARFFSLDNEEGGTTSIRSIDNGKLTIDNEYFDLQGRRVAQPTKGLYIVNGRKVAIK